MERVKVSVIIPVYNVEKYLSDCLTSALKQTLKEIEIICVNDGSTDRSMAILSEYARTDQRVVILEQANMGLSEARNTGLLHASGEFICLLDSDDMLAEDALEMMYGHATDKKLDVLCFDAEVLYETEALKSSNNQTGYFARKYEYGGVRAGKQLLADMMERDDFIVAAWLIFADRGWLERSGIRFKPGILHEDGLFCVECYLKAERIFYLNRRMYRYRIRENSIMTSGRGVRNLYSYICILGDLIKMMTDGGTDEKTGRALAKYAESYLINCEYVNSLLNEQEKQRLRFDDPYRELLGQCLKIGRYTRNDIDYNVYLAGFDSYVSEAKRIVLYGAGKIGTMAYSYLKLKGRADKVISFAVTEQGKNRDSTLFNSVEGLKAVPVTQFKDCDNRDTLFIISARREFQSDMEKQLRSIGISRYLKIDLQLEIRMNRCILEVANSERGM